MCRLEEPGRYTISGNVYGDKNNSSKEPVITPKYGRIAGSHEKTLSNLIASEKLYAVNELNTLF